MNPYDLRVSIGDKQEALEIIKEAAIWLEKKKERLWFPSDIDKEKISNDKDEFIVLWEKDISVAAMILNDDDNGLWGDRKKALYLHKLAVKRAFAGQGYSRKMIEYAIDYCEKKEISFLRLECDAKRKKLCKLYEKSGFIRINTKQFTSKKYGELEVGFYQINT